MKLASIGDRQAFTGLFHLYKHQLYGFALRLTQSPEWMFENVQNSDTFSRDSAGISLYPNPVKSILTISNIPEDATVSLFTISGKLLTKMKCTNSFLKMNVAKLESGVYVVKMHSTLGTRTRKLVIQN